MTTLQSGSATIYQFPLRGRFAVGANADEAKTTFGTIAARVAKVAIGTSWYHEEAIREEQPRRN